MPIKTYNVAPYYDDYDETKNYQRILFRPGVSVQTRELTQLQTALQAQIDRFGRHIFKDGSPAIGGLASLDTGFAYVKCETQFTVGGTTTYLSDTTVNREAAIGKVLTGGTSGVTATVLAVTATASPDPLTLFVKYTKAGTDTTTLVFAPGEILTGSGVVSFKVKAIVNDTVLPTGLGTRVSVNEGVFFVSGNFVYTPAASLILEKYTTNVNTRVVYKVVEQIVTASTDSTLTDNAAGSPNAAAPGAHRYQITLTLAKEPLLLSARVEANIIQLLVIENGDIKATARTEYSGLGDILAQRTFEESGNYTVRPFQVNVRELRNTGSNGGRYDTAQLRARYPLQFTGVDDTAKNTAAAAFGDARLAVGLEPSVAYVNGYRIASESTVYVEVEKARDGNVLNAASTLLPLGNYIYIDNVVSLPDIVNFSTINLIDGGSVTTAAVTGSVATTVLTVTAVSSGTLTVGSIISGTSITAGTKILSLGSGTGLTGTYNLSNSMTAASTAVTCTTGTARGTARARAIEYVSGTANTLAAIYKLYLFDIQMNAGYTFNNHAITLQQTLSTGPAFIANVADAISSGALRSGLQDTSNNSLVFALPVNTVKTLRSLSNFYQNDNLYTVKRKFDAVDITSLVCTLDTNNDLETFRSTNPADYLTIKVSDGTFITPSLVTLNTVNNIAGRSVTLTYGESIHVNIIAPTQRNIKEKTKTLSANTDVQIGAGRNVTPGGYDLLGKTDLFEVSAIYMSPNTSTEATNAHLNVTDRYIVDNGQRDNFYDQARIQLKYNAPAPVGQLLVVLKNFAHGDGDYFSVDSYPGVDYGAIPSYQSSKGFIQLRDAIDFRPIKGNNGNFTGSGLVRLFQPNSIMTTDIQHYLPRVDKIYVTKDGQFGVARGDSAINPVAPEDPKDAMVLYIIRLGAYTFSDADTIPTMIDNKRYTMRDIGKIEKRVTNLEYYTSLSLLEKDTANTQIFDATGNRFKNGFVVDSFYGSNVGAVTNNDYSVSMDRSAGRLRPMFYEDNLRLIFNSGISSNVRKTGSLLTLNYYTANYISQPYASYAENVNPYMVFSWTGDVVLSPGTDEWKETLRAPDVVIDQTGIYDSLIQMADSSGAIGTVWNEWQTNWTGEPASSTTETQTNSVNSGDGITGSTTVITDIATTLTATTTATSTRSGVRTSVVPDTVLTNMGDRVVEINFVPFIRSRKIYFKATRLKPNTRVYAFFDGISLADYIREESSAGRPGFVEYSTATDTTNYLNRTAHPDTATTLITDSVGQLIGSFIVPNTSAVKFKTGQRNFRLTDSLTNDTRHCDTSAECVYFAQGLMNTVENQVISTRVPVFSRSAVSDINVSTSTTRSVTHSVTSLTNSWAPNTVAPLPDIVIPVFDPPPTVVEAATGGGFTLPEPDVWDDEQLGRVRWTDPLAQSILIDTEGGVFLSGIDLWFKEKDQSATSPAPVSVEIRTMMNGAPTQTVVPFSKVTKAAGDVLVSANADPDYKTTFNFESPVYLAGGVEYCFVVMTNSDKYKLWVAELGQNDVTNTTYRITEQPYNGVMFKSANASTWTPEQTKDIKFAIRRCVFTDQTGVAVFHNAVIPTRLLGTDAIYTVSGSKVIRVFHKNHGHFAGSHVTLSGIAPTSGSVLNNILTNNLNTTHIIQTVTMDSYTIDVTANTNTSVANATGRAGGSAVRATENKTFNYINPIIQDLVLPSTDIQWSTRVTSGRSLAGLETLHQLATEYVETRVNATSEFSTPQVITSAPNITAGFPANGQSYFLKGEFVRSGPRDNLSPVIDLDRMSVITIANRIDNPDSTGASGFNDVDGHGISFVAETQSSGGSTLSKYITRKIELNEPADTLRIIVLANNPPQAGINLYYKVQTTLDQNFDALPWIGHASIANIGVSPVSPIKISDNPNSFSEVEYNIDPPGSFTAFAVKISLTSTNSSKVPSLRNFRAIALT